MSNASSIAWRGSCLLGIRTVSKPHSAQLLANPVLKLWTSRQQFSYASSSLGRIQNKLQFRQRFYSSPPTLSKSRIPSSNHSVFARFANTAAAKRKSDVEHGIAPRSNPLSAAEISSIFQSPKVSPEMGNRIISVLHKRRLEGTLDQNLPSDITRSVRSNTIEKGLHWLRKYHPLDEDAAIMARIEREEKEEEERIVQYVKGLGPQSGHWGAELGESGDIWGKSVIKEVREKNEERLIAEQEKERKEWLEGEAKEHERIQKQLQHNTQLQKYKPSEVVEARPRADPEQRPFLAWAQKHYIRAENTETDFTTMTTVRRILPAFGLTLLVLSLCYVYAETYKAPVRQSRMWPDIPPAAATVMGIMATNVAVWFLWKVPPAWRLLNRYFISVPLYPYAVSVVGSIFSHQQFRHLATNTLILWLIGLRLHDEIGRGNFLALYIASGVIGSLTSLASHVIFNKLTVTSLGASGAIAGLVAAWCMLHSDDKLVPSFLPSEWREYVAANGSTVLGLIVAFELFNLVSPFKVARLDHWAHLGGYFAGAAWAVLYKAKLERERRKRDDRGFLDRWASNSSR